MRVDGLLLDIDGVLAISWEPIEGAVDALAELRRDGVPFCLMTNTTTHTAAELAATLRSGGFDVNPGDVITAVTATAAHLRGAHPGAAVYVLTDGDPTADMGGIHVVGEPEAADVMVIGGACGAFDYETVNRVFRRLMDGAALVGMHRNRYWRTSGGWEMDSGGYITGLESAAGLEAVTCGKPAPPFFRAALDRLGVAADRAAMVGDDIENDVLGAQGAGLTGILVRTGKYRETDLERGAPDVVLPSFADVPAWVRGPT